jgi:superfamily II DNA/RNA helicase
MQFSDLHLPAPLLKAVHELGYTAPTAIQEKTIPLILSGKDIIGHSQTGSGKTAAFGLPMLSTLTPHKGVQGLILTPTRELCVQVSDALRGFSKHLPFRIVPVYGGVGIGPQIQATRTADIIVATPGRLLDLMGRGLKLHFVKYLVLDEADRMLDMGFIDDVEKILRAIPKQRQTMLFSATMSPRIQALVHRYMNAPVAIQTKTHVDTSLLTEKAYNVQPHDKLSLLAHFLKHETPGIAIVFCATRHGCDKVAKRMRAAHIDATPIHGGLSQSKRIATIDALHRSGEGILVATDVASRGLHINNISHVYNYDLPNTSDDYTHRIGRTARAGAKGDAITFVTPQDANDFKSMTRNLKRIIPVAPLPTFEKLILPPEAPRPHHAGHRPQGGPRPGGRPFWKRARR